MIILQFLDECLKYIFFQLPRLKKKCCLGGGDRSGEVTLAYQVMKKLKIDNLSLYTLYPIPCRKHNRM